MSFRRQVWCGQNQISVEQLVVKEMETDLPTILKARNGQDGAVSSKGLAGQGQNVFYGHRSRA